MALLTEVFIFLALFGTVYGEVFYERFDGFYNAGVRFSEVALFRSTMCYNGDNVYYTLQDGTVNILATNEVIATHSLTTTILGNVDCCCGVVAYGVYYIENAVFKVYVEFVGRNVGTVFEISENVPEHAAVVTDCQEGLLYVISQNITWTFSLSNPSANVNMQNHSPMLPYNPRCASVFTNSSGGHVHFFITFEGAQEMVIIEANTGITFTFMLTANGNLLNLYCVTVEDNTVHGFGRDPVLVNFVGQDILFTLDAQLTLAAALTNMIVTVATTVIFSHSSPALFPLTNGITYCSNCTFGCMDANCTACDDECGFCSPDSGDCVCENSALDECIYENSTDAEQCLGALLVPDAFCIVKYPLANRRVPPSITVLGYSNEPAYISVGRRVKTGRWPITALPKPREYIVDNNGVVGPSYKGFRAPVPGKGRGRRFGVYYADIEPIDVSYRDDRICCLVTENSGFYNKYYTYTRSLGDNVTLSATLYKRRFRPQLRWGYTSESAPSTLVDINLCDKNLSCAIEDLSKDDQGVYQVYRAGRYLRTWHPIFYLFVRCCPEGYYGANCDSTCDQCVKGVCDDISGECTCYAGWTGDSCNMNCPAGRIGQNCDTKCDGLFEDGGSDYCENLSICLPGKAGCSCYSGLEPPECSEPCEDDTYGPNCVYDCENDGCDPRTGV